MPRLPTYLDVPQSSARITFQQGLLESQESSKLDIGFLTECQNWVPEPNGALRVRAGWSQGSINGLTTIRRCRGIGMFSKLTDPFIVQQSSVYVSANASATPSLSWATPTTVGNTLVAIVNVVSGGSGSFTFTATGWTARQAIGALGGTDFPQVGIYELVTTQAYSGATTPFTYSTAVSQNSIIIYILELSGVSTFDKIARVTSTAATGSLTYSQAVTTAATTQSAELTLGVTSAIRYNASQPSFTISTPTAGWSAQYQTGSATNVPFANAHHRAALFHKSVRTSGTQTITSTITAPDTFATNAQDVALITYKSWNTVASPSDSGNRWLAANDDGGTYDIVSIDRAINTFALNGPWLTIDTNLGTTTAGDPVAFTNGLGNAWYTSATFSGIRKYDGNVASYISGSPVGARCIALHYNRLWAGAGSRLSFTQIGDGTAWTGTGSGYFDIGRDDGEVIEDITPFAGGLVIGKKTSLTFLTGSSTTDFSPVPLDGGGAAPGRSILATPYGCVIAGLEQVWSFDGSQVRPLGRGIENSYGLTDQDFVSTSYIDGSVYIAVPSLNKVFVFNLNAGTWRTETIGDGAEESAAIVYNYGPTQLYGPWAGTIGSIVNYRTFPDPSRTKDFDPLPEHFIAQTGDLSLAGARRPITPRQLFLQLRQRGGDTTEPGLIVTPVFDGELGDACDVDSAEIGVRRVSVGGFAQSEGAGVNTVGVRISQTVDAGDSSLHDVEDVFLDFTIENARP